jgi:hypothetical protein
MWEAWEEAPLHLGRATAGSCYCQSENLHSLLYLMYFKSHVPISNYLFLEFEPAVYR